MAENIALTIDYDQLQVEMQERCLLMVLSTIRHKTAKLILTSC